MIQDLEYMKNLFYNEEVVNYNLAYIMLHGQLNSKSSPLKYGVQSYASSIMPVYGGEGDKIIDYLTSKRVL